MYILQAVRGTYTHNLHYNIRVRITDPRQEFSRDLITMYSIQPP